MENLIFSKSSAGRGEKYLAESFMPEIACDEIIPEQLRRREMPLLPQMTEGDVIRHFTRLSRLNYGVDTGFYPLGSCTMKYNPKINEDAANLPGFRNIHPYQPEDTVQGALCIMHETQKALAEIAGMDHVTLQPAAGAHGEFTGLMIIMAYHAHNGQHKRTKVIVPDSSHGTNPATAALCGCSVVQIPSNSTGGVDLNSLHAAVGEDTAALMLTNPSTLGLFETQIEEITSIVHDAGGLVYYDGANMNAIMGYARPGDMGFDVIHFNLHKTFSTPHGGGGPGSGPVGVKKELRDFLPKPITNYDMSKDRYYLDYDLPYSIGKVKSFYGNFGVIVKAYAYILRMGGDGLKAASEKAVLNANYLMAILSDAYYQPFPGPCKHEFIITPQPFKNTGIRTMDVAKRLIDYGFHPPTVYFPLIVEEALMIEPTETENKETLDEFAKALHKIAEEARDNPEILHTAPHNTPVSRLDEVAAARKPVLRWKP